MPGRDGQPSLADLPGDNDDKIQRTLGIRMVLERYTTAGSDPLWRHSAVSSDGGLRVTRPLTGFGPVSVTL